jgi:hypothetical protein
MRREDKNRVPRRLKVKLPPGYHLERVPDGYVLYFSYETGIGCVSVLVGLFKVFASTQEIGAAATAHLSKGGLP